MSGGLGWVGSNILEPSLYSINHHYIIVIIVHRLQTLDKNSRCSHFWFLSTLSFHVYLYIRPYNLFLTFDFVTVVSGVAMDCAGRAMHNGPPAFRGHCRLYKYFRPNYHIRNGVGLPTPERRNNPMQQCRYSKPCSVREIACQFVVAATTVSIFVSWWELGLYRKICGKMR